jgi:hypothetical protein
MDEMERLRQDLRDARGREYGALPTPDAFRRESAVRFAAALLSGADARTLGDPTARGLVAARAVQLADELIRALGAGAAVGPVPFRPSEQEGE